MKTSKTFKEAISNLLAAGNDIVRAEDETHYVHVPTGRKLMRTTNYIEGMKPFMCMPEWKGSLGMGSAADQLFRDYFVEGEDYVRDQRNFHGGYAELSDRAVLECLTSVRAFDAVEVKPYGWTVLADRVFLYSLELGVAGEVDLILYKEETREVKIIDMKTVRSPQYISRKVDKYSRQLNTYRVMAEELMGGWDVTDLEILWIKTTYEKYDTVSQTAYLHSILPVESTDRTEDIRAIWQKEKGMNPEEYSFDAPKETESRGTSNLVDALLK